MHTLQALELLLKFRKCILNDCTYNSIPARSRLLSQILSGRYRRHLVIRTLLHIWLNDFMAPEMMGIVDGASDFTHVTRLQQARSGQDH